MIVAYRNGLKPPLCVGENLEEREAGKTARKINMRSRVHCVLLHLRMLKTWLLLMNPYGLSAAKGKATPSDAQEVCRLIREKKSASSLLLMLLARYVFCTVAVLTKTIVASFNISGIDGVLVGGASLKADSFVAIVRSF